MNGKELRGVRMDVTTCPEPWASMPIGTGPDATLTRITAPGASLVAPAAGKILQVTECTVSVGAATTIGILHGGTILFQLDLPAAGVINLGNQLAPRKFAVNEAFGIAVTGGVAVKGYVCTREVSA